MPSNEERVRQLREKVAQRQQERAQAEVQLGIARQREKGALEALAKEYGVSSVQEAAKLMVARQADLDQACAESEAALKEAGG